METLMLDRASAKRLIRKGRRITGGIYDLDNGKEIYVAYRKQSDMIREGEKSLSDAIQKKKAAWAVDNDTLIRLRTEGIYLLGIQTKETGDLYVATLGDFLAAPVSSSNRRNVGLQRQLTLDKFLIQLGSVKPKPKIRKRAAA
jgi:hypothetical protein